MRMVDKIIKSLGKNGKMAELFIKQLETAKNKGLMKKEQADGWIAQIKKDLENARKEGLK